MKEEQSPDEGERRLAEKGGHVWGAHPPQDVDRLPGGFPEPLRVRS